MGHYASEMAEEKSEGRGEVTIDPRALRKAHLRDSDGPHYEYTDKVREVHNVFAEIESLVGVMRTRLSPVLNDMMPMPAPREHDNDEDKPTQSELLSELDRLKDHGRQVERYVQNLLNEIHI